MRLQTPPAAALAAALTVALALASGALHAQTAAPAKKAVTPAVKAKSARAAKPTKPAPPPPDTPPPAAEQAQIEAAERVYYGLYECEFKQSVDISMHPKYVGYVDVKHGKENYVMKPVVSATGAIRLEDVRGQTLMVQIANKSMLLDVTAGRRIVDDCISPKQRELIDAARQARAANGGAAPAGGLLDK